jgi:hypothetical protein
MNQSTKTREASIDSLHSIVAKTKGASKRLTLVND